MASSVDRSILHLRFILHNLPASKKGDVLLLKKFLKANGLYGAEIRVEGFSGYLCELLIIKYGGFLSALKAISKWKLPVRLHLGNGKGKEFPEAPLTFIDPVDPDRNVAAIVSKENLLRLMSLAKHFLVKPSSVYFSGDDENFRKKQLDRFLKSKGPKRLLAFKRPKLVDDILWGQLKRLSRAIIVSAEAFEFEVSDTYLFADKKECRLYFSFSTETLSSFASVRGPPVKMNEHCVRFRKSHPNASFSTKNGHIYAKIKRGVRAIDAALIQILKKRHGFPSHIPSAMSLSTLE
jgi:tRNA nucleotidyltransferase (CCA-adding enzyme)